MRFYHKAIIRVLFPAFSSLAIGSNTFCSDEVADVCIVGGGVVGLSVARQCATKFNSKVILIEKEDAVSAG